MNIKIALDRSMRKTDGNGHLIVEETIITKAAVNPYKGSEIPNGEALGLDPDTTYYLLRDPTELKAALDTFKGIQLMIKHIPVNADEPSKTLTVGAIGTDLDMRGNDVYASMRVWDQAGIDLIESKKLQELSAGYAYTADMTKGEWNGQPYDGVMRNIHGNHVALVERGRIGPDAIIADHLPIELREEAMKLKKGSMPKIMAALRKIALDGGEITEDTVEEVVKTVGDSLEETEPKAKDSECKKAEDNDDAKGKDEQTQADRDNESEAQRLKDREKREEEDRNSDKKPAMDAAMIESNAVAKVTALFEAREAVKPLVGQIGMDSAEQVYKYALDHGKIDTAGVHPSAYKSMANMLLSQHAKQSAVMAMDSNHSIPDDYNQKITSRFG